MSVVRHPVVVISVFLWIGFVCAISFMEAWIKFQAPGISVTLGLGIGRLVFGALNKVEWVLMLATLLHFVKPFHLFSSRNVLILVPVVILLLQTFWMLPYLDARADILLNGGEVPPSKIHFYYIACEVCKVLSLVIFGISRFEKKL